MAISRVECLVTTQRLGCGAARSAARTRAARRAQRAVLTLKSQNQQSLVRECVLAIGRVIAPCAAGGIAVGRGRRWRVRRRLASRARTSRAVGAAALAAFAAVPVVVVDAEVGVHRAECVPCGPLGEPDGKMPPIAGGSSPQ